MMLLLLAGDFSYFSYPEMQTSQQIKQIITGSKGLLRIRSRLLLSVEDCDAHNCLCLSGLHVPESLHRG